MRRQARGRLRIESILDAAEQIIAETGYDAMGMNAVASRASISPGSLYQFFGSKPDILDALVERYSALIDQFWDSQLTPDAEVQPLDDLVDGLIDAIVAFKSARPAFWALFHGSVASENLAAAARRLDRRLVERLDELFAARAPHLGGDQRQLVAEVAVATTKSLMALIINQPPGRQQTEAARELKQVLLGYLGPALAAPDDT